MTGKFSKLVFELHIYHHEMVIYTYILKLYYYIVYSVVKLLIIEDGHNCDWWYVPHMSFCVILMNSLSDRS